MSIHKKNSIRLKYLAVFWETGYRNIQIFYEGRLVHLIEHPGKLEEGFKIEDK